MQILSLKWVRCALGCRGFDDDTGALVLWQTALLAHADERTLQVELWAGARALITVLHSQPGFHWFTIPSAHLLVLLVSENNLSTGHWEKS